MSSSPTCLAFMAALFLQVAGVRVNIRPYRHAILQSHNFYRRQEPAANMRSMSWDYRLEQRAAHWAESCYFEHQRRGLGENLSYFSSSGRGLAPKAVIKRSISLWASEKRLYRWSRGCGAACHYTQLVWAPTSRVGCALSYCPVIRTGYQLQRNAMYFVCFYTPPGNVIGQYPFIQGRRCAKCGRGQGCFRGLCSGRGYVRSRGRRRYGYGRRKRSIKLPSKQEFLGLVQERSEY